MDEDMRTLWCGNLSEKVTEEILYELFLQGGPVQRVSIPKDRDGKRRTYGFVTYKHIKSVAYALELFAGTMLFNRTINIKPRNNLELPQTETPHEQSFDLNQVLQSGQQMLLGNQPSHMRIDMRDMNMLPSTGPYSRQADVYSSKEGRRPRRMHPYHRDNDKDNNRHRDHKSRNARNNHHSDDYYKQDYKSNRRSYR